MTTDLDTMIRTTLTEPMDLKAASRTLDHMRFTRRMTYRQCVEAVAKVLPDVDYEMIAGAVDDYEAHH